MSLLIHIMEFSTEAGDMQITSNSSEILSQPILVFSEAGHKMPDKDPDSGKSVFLVSDAWIFDNQ